MLPRISTVARVGARLAANSSVGRVVLPVRGGQISRDGHTAIVAARPPVLPPPLDPSAFVGWQNQLLAGPEGERL